MTNLFSFNSMSRKLREELKLSFGNNIQLSICCWISTTSRPSDEIWLQPQNSFRFCFFIKKKNFYPAASGLKNNSPNDKMKDSVLIVVKQRHRAIVVMPLMRKNEPQGRIFGKVYYNACQFLKQSRLPILQFFWRYSWFSEALRILNHFTAWERVPKFLQPGIW